MDHECKFTAPKEQHDIIFIPQDKGLLEIEAGDSVMRIRTEKDSIKLTYKEHITGHFDCIEEELEIADPQVMRNILERLSFKEISQVRKKRVTTTYNEYEICFDEVEGLGSFIEVEKIVPDGEGDGVQDELYQFLFSLGFTQDDVVAIGYDVLAYKIKNNL